MPQNAKHGSFVWGATMSRVTLHTCWRPRRSPSPGMSLVSTTASARLNEETGSSPRGVAVLADDDGHSQLPRDQQRLVTIFARGSQGIDRHHSCSHAPVATREDIEKKAVLFQPLAQQNKEWPLARTPNREIANTYHRPLQVAEGQRPAVVKFIARPYGRAVECRERIHARRSEVISAGIG